MENKCIPTRDDIVFWNHEKAGHPDKSDVTKTNPSSRIRVVRLAVVNAPRCGSRTTRCAYLCISSDTFGLVKKRSAVDSRSHRGMREEQTSLCYHAEARRPREATTCSANPVKCGRGQQKPVIGSPFCTSRLKGRNDSKDRIPRTFDKDGRSPRHSFVTSPTSNGVSQTSVSGRGCCDE